MKIEEKQYNKLLTLQKLLSAYRSVLNISLYNFYKKSSKSITKIHLYGIIPTEGSSHMEFLIIYIVLLLLTLKEENNANIDFHKYLADHGYFINIKLKIEVDRAVNIYKMNKLKYIPIFNIFNASIYSDHFTENFEVILNQLLEKNILFTMDKEELEQYNLNKSYSSILDIVHGRDDKSIDEKIYKALSGDYKERLDETIDINQNIKSYENSEKLKNIREARIVARGIREKLYDAEMQEAIIKSHYKNRNK